MPAKIWDSTTQAFKDAETPKIWDSTNNAFADSVGKVFVNGVATDAWVNNVYGLPGTYIYRAGKDDPKTLFQGYTNVISEPITQAQINQKFLSDGIHLNETQGQASSQCRTIYYKTPLTINANQYINVYFKSVVNNSTTRYPQIDVRFANNVGADTTVIYNMLFNGTTNGYYSVTDVAKQVKITNAVSNKYLLIMIIPSGQGYFDMSAIVSAISISNT